MGLPAKERPLNEIDWGLTHVRRWNLKLKREEINARPSSHLGPGPEKDDGEPGPGVQPEGDG